MTRNVLPGAEEFSHDGGPVGVLLCHGFTGSPASMAPWGRHLAELGMTVRVPRLPGHGTHWRDLNATTWTDWYAAVDAALTDLVAHCDQGVAVCGLSMGGALALRLAEQRPGDVGALVLVNPAIAMRRRDLALVPLMSRVIGSLPGIGNDIAKPGVDEISYDRTPLAALASQLKLWRDARDHLDLVRCPVLFFHSENDHVVDDSSLQLVTAALDPAQLELVTLTRSYHVATLDHDADAIMERSAAFIADHTGQRPPTTQEADPA